MTEIKRALTESFKELMREKSFQKIIVKDITDRARVKRPTFYSYFRDKYDVVEWIFRQDIWEPGRSLMRAGYTKEALRFVLISMEKDSDFYRKLTAVEGQNSFREILERCVREEVSNVLHEKDFHSDMRLLTVETIAEYLAHIFWFVIEKWLNSDADVSALEVLEIYSVLASDSLENILQTKFDSTGTRKA